VPGDGTPVADVNRPGSLPLVRLFSGRHSTRRGPTSMGVIRYHLDVPSWLILSMHCVNAMIVMHATRNIFDRLARD
jgi:hypothetical protein